MWEAPGDGEILVQKLNYQKLAKLTVRTTSRVGKCPVVEIIRIY